MLDSLCLNLCAQYSLEKIQRTQACVFFCVFVCECMGVCVCVCINVGELKSAWQGIKIRKCQGKLQLIVQQWNKP